VLRVAVPTQIDFALECFVTETTGERLVAGVFPHVSDEVRRLTECLLAYYAFVGLLTWNRANCEQIYKFLFFLRPWDRAYLMYSSITNKMQRYAMVFITVNAVLVSGGSSAHHQELKTVYTASSICRAFLLLTVIVGELEQEAEKARQIPHAV